MGIVLVLGLLLSAAAQNSPLGVWKTIDDETEERSESDVTDEDLQALGPKDLSMDMGEDEQLLKNRGWPVALSGADLDVPGTELDDAGEEVAGKRGDIGQCSQKDDGHMVVHFPYIPGKGKSILFR